MRSSPARSVLAVGLAAALAVAALAGCGRGSMVGRRVDDFSAYYNTFYNARNAFDDAVETLDDAEAPVDRDRYLSVFRSPEQVQSREAFEQAIDKSADVLRDHPNSKWVDDALLLIGKSYFYLENYVGAQQKFNEVIGREGSELEDEARLWLGRTLMSAGRYAAAGQRLIEGLEQGRSERWTSRMKLVLGELRVRQDNEAEAVPLLEEGLAGVGDGQARARALFLRGQVLEALARYDDAAAAYQRAAGERPRYELGYAAETGALRMLAQAGQVNDALRRLARLARDDKNADKRAELRLLRGQFYEAEGAPDRGRNVLRDLLYQDPDAPDRLVLSGAVRGRTHYALATLYRDAYEDFSKAAAHFDTAASSIDAGAGEERLGRLTTYALTDVRDQADRFGSVAEAGQRLSRLDSLLRLGAMTQSNFDAFVDSLRHARAEEQREAAQKAERRRNEQRFQGRGGTQNRRGGTGGQRGSNSSLVSGGTNAAGTGEGDASFLFHADAARVQEGRVGFQRIWGRRPRVPNWRRITAISSQHNATAPGQPADEIGPDDSNDALALPEVDVSAIPRDTARQREMRSARAVARYELGNALLLAIDRPDSAAAWFRRVIEEDAERPVSRRAYYALAEAERAAGRQEEARRLYRQIIRERPNTELARRARTRVQGETSAAAQGESAEAEQAYADAYGEWQGAQYATALQDMVDVAAGHARTPSAARALLAAAEIYLEWANQTGRPLAAPLPVHAPDSLFEAGALFGSDTLAADAPPLPDSARIAADTPASAQADSSEVEALATDSLATDSLAASPGALAGRDTTAIRDATLAPLVAAPAHALHLEDLLTGLVRRYPETPHAARSERILQALQERRSPPAASTPQVLPADSTSKAPNAARDTTRSPSPAGTDPSASVPDSTAQQSAPRETERGAPLAPGTLERAAGGWTIAVASKKTREDAEALARRLRERFRAGVLEAEANEGTRYRVGVGQFRTREEARAAQQRLQAALPGDSWLLELGSKRN